MKTVKMMREVPIADCDGEEIFVGSVLENIKDGNRGVVTKIYQVGDTNDGFAMVGDVRIELSPGCDRVTNIYHEWKHIPREQNTHRERFVAWLNTSYDHDEWRGISRDEALAVDGLLSLLPEDPRFDDDQSNWFEDRLEYALKLVVEHIEELRGKV